MSQSKFALFALPTLKANSSSTVLIFRPSSVISSCDLQARSIFAKRMHLVWCQVSEWLPTPLRPPFQNRKSFDSIRNPKTKRTVIHVHPVPVWLVNFKKLALGGRATGLLTIKSTIRDHQLAMVSMQNYLQINLDSLGPEVARDFHGSCGNEEIRVDRVVSSFRVKRRASGKDCTQQQPKASPTDKPKRGKEVRFVVDSNDHIVEDVHSFQRYLEEDLKQVFWSSNERLEFLHNARYDCDNVELDESEVLDNLDTIYADSEENNKSVESIVCWTASAGRGLESALMTSIRRSGRKHKKRVLNCQKKHRDRRVPKSVMRQVLRAQASNQVRPLRGLPACWPCATK